MSRSVDLLIVGAGIQGATAAWAATRRGLSVLLVDRGDVGGGASSNSLKIAHGGVRYLQSLDLRRSFESVRERRRLVTLAPRWVRPLSVRVDLSDRGFLWRLALRAGLRANDLLSLHRNRGVPATHRLVRLPYPRWQDALIEDTERVLLGFLHAARAAGPEALEVRPHARIEGETRREGRLVGAEVSGLGHVSFRAMLRCVGATRPGQKVVLAMNLMVDPLPLTRDGFAVGLAHADDRRNLFVVPWRGRTMIGTWYRDYPFDPSEPLRVETAWVQECLEWMRAAHPALASISRKTLRLVHAGLLPAEGSHPSDRPWLERQADGSFDVQGVKWTTACGLSERAVARVARELGHGGAPGPARPLPDLEAERERWIAAEPARAETLVPGEPDLRVGDVLFAVEREWAQALEDVLLRRTGLAAAGHPGHAAVDAVAGCLQTHLDWSERERRDQVEAFHASFRFAGRVPD